MSTQRPSSRAPDDPVVRLYMAALHAADQAARFEALGNVATARACWREASVLAERSACLLEPDEDGEEVFGVAAQWALRAADYPRAEALSKRASGFPANEGPAGA